MKVLLVGSGGREHALAWKLNQSKVVSELLLWPGNPAMAGLGQIPDWPAAIDWADVVRRSQEAGVDFVVVGPEKPLAEGLADLCEQAGLPVFGPNQAVAQLEASKAFAKDVMQAAGIPTAAYETADDQSTCDQQARRLLHEKGGVVLKASGLAGGKGVFVCRSVEELEHAMRRLYGQNMMKAAETVVLEEILEGRECSYFALVGREGSSYLGFAVDFKRLQDGDLGPNTGGMGCYTPVPWLPDDAAKQVDEQIVAPLLAELDRRQMTYHGCLYVGLMWGKNGPAVVEFNVRLGDPEAQVLAVSDERDWGAMIAEQLGFKTHEPVAVEAGPEWPAVAVVMASSAYPYGGDEQPAKVLPADIFTHQDKSLVVFGAAIASGEEGQLLTGQGRVLTVAAGASNLADARTRCYRQVEELARDWLGVQYRHDIAQRVISDSRT